MKVRLSIVALTGLAACAAVAGERTLASFEGTASAGARIESVIANDGTSWSVRDGVLRVETPGGWANHGVRLAGEWDLSQATEVRFEVRAPGRRVPLTVGVRTVSGPFDTKALWGWGELTGAGAQEEVGDAWRTIAVRLPPPCPAARELASRLRLMRATPFTRWNLQGAYDAAKTTGLVVYLQERTIVPQALEIRRVAAGDDAPRMALPDYCRMTPEEFFPFVDRYGQFKYADWPGKVKSDADLRTAREREDRDLAAHPGPGDRDRWGGWAKGPQLKATGRFRVEKADGKWWFVDPDGRLWWSHGPVRVSSSCSLTMLDDGRGGSRRGYFADLPAEDALGGAFYRTCEPLLARYYGSRPTFDFSSANAWRKYGANWRGEYADRAHRRLRSWGLNTIANSSDHGICFMDRTPYTDRAEIRDCRSFATSGGAWYRFKDPFDPSFRAALAKDLASRRRELEDPWCFGLFVDNELPWGRGGDIARWALAAGDESPACRYAKKRLADAGRTAGTADEKLLGEISAAIAEEYFRVVKDELAKAAPHMLYLGCRFDCTAPDFVLRAAARHCDVVSFNIYGRDLSDRRLPDGVDRPVIVGEFHMGATDRGPFHTGVIGCRSQAERARGYVRYVRSALENPQIVGVHWHQFGDQPATGRFDGECFQVGLVDCCDTPYPETVAAIREIAYPMYEIRRADKSHKAH